MMPRAWGLSPDKDEKWLGTQAWGGRGKWIYNTSVFCQHFMWLIHLCEGILLHEFSSLLCHKETSWNSQTFIYSIHFMASLHLSCLKTTSCWLYTFMACLHFMCAFHDCLLPPSLPITSWLYPTPVFKIHFMIYFHFYGTSLLHDHLTPMCTNYTSWSCCTFMFKPNFMPTLYFYEHLILHVD